MLSTDLPLVQPSSPPAVHEDAPALGIDKPAIEVGKPFFDLNKLAINLDDLPLHLRFRVENSAKSIAHPNAGLPSIDVDTVVGTPAAELDTSADSKPALAAQDGATHFRLKGRWAKRRVDVTLKGMPFCIACRIVHEAYLDSESNDSEAEIVVRVQAYFFEAFHQFAKHLVGPSYTSNPLTLDEVASLTSKVVDSTSLSTPLDEVASPMTKVADLPAESTPSPLEPIQSTSTTRGDVQPAIVPPTEPEKPQAFSFSQTAAEYSSRGFSLVPQQPGAKNPCVRWKPFQKRKPTDNDIESWSQQFPDAGISAVLGPLSNLLVIDVDGPEAHAALTAKLGDEPVAPKVLSGSGDPYRYHLYFLHPDGVRTRARYTPWHGKLEFRC